MSIQQTTSTKASSLMFQNTINLKNSESNMVLMVQLHMYSQHISTLIIVMVIRRSSKFMEIKGSSLLVGRSTVKEYQGAIRKSRMGKRQSYLEELRRLNVFIHHVIPKGILFIIFKRVMVRVQKMKWKLIWMIMDIKL